MPIHVTWDNDEQTVIRYEFRSPWTWEEYRTAIEEAWALAGTVPHPTDTITDMSGSRLLPDGLFHNVGKSVVEIPDTTRTVVLVGGGMFVEAMLGVLKRIYPRAATKFFITRTVEEARTLIHQRRQGGTTQP